MHPLVLLAAAALRPGAQALTLGPQSADPDGPGDGPIGQRADAALKACLAAAGLPDCPQRGGVDLRPAVPGCLDAALLAEDMSDLGIDPEGCAAEDTRADAVHGAAVNPNAFHNDPVAGQVPRANVSHTKPVIWVHIHKSMGTFIYMLAHSSGENIVQPSYNGNWWPYDTPPDGGGRKIDCAKRREYFDWANATWGQIEHQMENHNLCHEQFNYGILLRDPNKLAISKASMESYSSAETLASLGCLVGSSHKEHLDWACDNAAPTKNTWSLWWFWDNFLVRMLAGGAVWGLPPGEITEQHAHLAIQRLSKFNVVMFAEDFEDKGHLESTIGWRPEKYDKVWKRPSSHVVELTDEQEAQARVTNRFDYMVYDHFKSMPIQQRVNKFQ